MKNYFSKKYFIMDQHLAPLHLADRLLELKIDEILRISIIKEEYSWA